MVKRRGGLVEQQDLGALRQGAREHRPLLLADRELGDVAIGKLRPEAGESEAAIAVELLTDQACGEAEVGLDRALEQGGKLRHQRHLAAQRPGIAVGEWSAPIENTAPLGVDEAV